MIRDPRFTLARVLWHLPRFIKVFWGLLRDPRVMAWTKVLPFLGLVYAVIPLDFDFIIGLGWIDDVLVLYLCLWAFVRLAPPSVVQEYVARASKG